MELKDLPSMTKFIESRKFSNLGLNRIILKKIINDELNEFRKKIIKDSSNKITNDLIEDQILKSINSILKPSPNIVINGTGVVLHTNLGRAPISKNISKDLINLVNNYSDLEIDISTKKRNTRTDNTAKLLSLLTDCESSIVFNNNALALVVCLGSLGKNKEILVSRSESIEIGGGFRIPEIIKMSGLKLIDVGTTNKTYISDYENNITEKTAGILKVHKSNYQIKGFTNNVDTKDLKKLGSKYNIPIIHDLGSGNLIETKKYKLPHEPTIIESLKEGSDISLFSGDKLLGGPQSGIIIGKRKYIEKISKHPLARAARIDKLNLFLLNQTLIQYLKENSDRNVLSWSLINENKKNLLKRAKNIIEKIPKRYFEINASAKSTIGGGTFPESYLESVSITMNNQKLLNKFERYMLHQKIPTLGKIENNSLMLDLRTIFPEYDNYLIDTINKFFNNDFV